MATGIGQRIRRREDPRFLLGRGRYVDDTRVENALHVTFVRSYVAHGTITSIDAEEARALPGVQVFTAADLGLQPSPPPPMLQVHESMFRAPMAADKVRYVGEIVAAVVAETREASVDAAAAGGRRLRRRCPRSPTSARRSRTRSCSSSPRAPTRACASRAPATRTCSTAATWSSPAPTRARACSPCRSSRARPWPSSRTASSPSASRPRRRIRTRRASPPRSGSSPSRCA